MAEPPWVYQMLEDDERKKAAEARTAERRESFKKRLAKLLWIEAGFPEGRDLEFWLEAEKRVNEMFEGK